MKHLTLTPEDRQRFAMLYTGFITGGDMRQQGEQKGMQVIRLEGKILDKLEDISVPDVALGRLLKPGEWTLEFTEDEFAMILRYVQRAEWHTRVARQVVEMVDWLEHA